jgi:hypothetical protein
LRVESVAMLLCKIPPCLFFTKLSFNAAGVWRVVL